MAMCCSITVLIVLIQFISQCEIINSISRDKKMRWMQSQCTSTRSALWLSGASKINQSWTSISRRSRAHGEVLLQAPSKNTGQLILWWFGFLITFCFSIIRIYFNSNFHFIKWNRLSDKLCIQNLTMPLNMNWWLLSLDYKAQDMLLCLALRNGWINLKYGY